MFGIIVCTFISLKSFLRFEGWTENQTELRAFDSVQRILKVIQSIFKLSTAYIR